MKSKVLLRSIVGIASAMLLSNCSSDGTSTSSGSDTLTGYYVDSPVVGVDYTTTSGISKTTGEGGAFEFKSGDTVEFKIAGYTLRTASGLTDNEKVIEENPAIATFLQSIDVDGNVSNNITITDEVKSLVETWLADTTSIDINGSDGKINNIAALEQAFNDNDINATAVIVADAMEHVNETKEKEGIEAEYIYYTNAGKTRKATITTGAAEYHTGTGYGSTLFDSADNKCQHCHNELYDTWKGSMHGQSWADPIFQSKYQDFLRTHIAKLGTNPTGSKEYTKGMLEKGVSATCIKCHAPGAYYAGDFKATVEKIQGIEDMNASMLASIKAANEQNIVGKPGYNPQKPFTVVAPNTTATQGGIYKLTFEIGHEANREGINCAFCHSIETPRMMKDGDQYTLKKDMRVGPHGPIKGAAGTTLTWNRDATDGDMNKFFRLWGPEKPADYANTRTDATDTSVRAVDGRYTMAGKNIHDENNTHYTGGPFYGPFGVTGTSNENSTDESNRSAMVNPNFGNADINPHFGGGTGFNHFAENGKALCLSCHQRSAGAFDGGAGEFMELCSTQMAVTTGTTDNVMVDTMSSPKCQKCHMERIEGKVLHRWARPDQNWTTENNPHLTAHFDPDNTTVTDNPVRDGWLNSHAFLGGSKTAKHSSDKKVNGGMVVAKIKSGFDATLDSSTNGDTLTVTATLKNLTAHMFPGAHPMRRVLTRVIVTDANGTMLTPTSVTAKSEFGDIENTIQTRKDKTLHSSQPTKVAVNNAGNRSLDFTGKVDDFSEQGEPVSSQKFYSAYGTGKVTVSAVDGTVKEQNIVNGKVVGKVFNSAITDVDSNSTAKFTRIYGHETGKMLDHDDDNTTAKIFVVRPGFDSNKVAKDTRLSPNETETYTLTYDITGKTGVSATYKVYYMQKGANGQFIEAADGFLDKAKSDTAKHLVTEVFSDTK